MRYPFIASVWPENFNAKRYDDANGVGNEILNREDVTKDQVPERSVTDANEPRCLIELHCFNDETGCERQ